MCAEFMPRRPYRQPHLVAVVALDGVNPFDLAIPCEVFGRTRLADGRAPYRVRVCGTTATVHAGAFDVRVAHGLRGLAGARTIVVPGIEDVTGPLPRPPT